MRKVETNVAIPRIRQPNRYGFQDLKVGESKFFPGKKSNCLAHMAARRCGQYRGWKFLSRTMDGGLRIWRIE